MRQDALKRTSKLGPEPVAGLIRWKGFLATYHFCFTETRKEFLRHALEGVSSALIALEGSSGRAPRKRSVLGALGLGGGFMSITSRGGFGM